MKRRILFVDDEPKVLGGLQRMLYGSRLKFDQAQADEGVFFTPAAGVDAVHL